MAKFIKAIQCRNCGHVMDISDFKHLCSKCSAPTGLKVYGSKTHNPTAWDHYFGHYRVYYEENTMKRVIAKKGLFGRLKYVRDMKEDETF